MKSSLFFCMMLLISSALTYATPLQASGELDPIPDTTVSDSDPCHAVKGNSLSPFFFIKNKANNYVQYFDYLLCRLSNRLQLTPSEVQGMTIFSMFREIENYYREDYLKRAVNESPIYNGVINDGMLTPFDHFLNANSNARVVIINDDHARMETRALFLSLLPKLRSMGYDCIAMEALQDLSQTRPSFFLGYYFQEPIMAEIYRTAKRLGMKVIQYEYTGPGTNETRDSMQALNLFNQIKMLREESKVIVFSGQSHLWEDCSMCPALFGNVFKKISNIDPLTIDQTRGMSWAGYLDIHFDMANVIYGGIVKSSAISIKDKFGCSFVDAFYIHPQYSYIEDRPSWLSCGGIRKPYKIKKLYSQKAALIQVYYKKEVVDAQGYNFVTPADMVSGSTPANDVTCYLVPGQEYVMVYRDAKNAILYIQKLGLR